MDKVVPKALIPRIEIPEEQMLKDMLFSFCEILTRVVSPVGGVMVEVHGIFLFDNKSQFEHNVVLDVKHEPEPKKAKPKTLKKKKG